MEIRVCKVEEGKGRRAKRGERRLLWLWVHAMRIYIYYYDYSSVRDRGPCRAGGDFHSTFEFVHQ